MDGSSGEDRICSPLRAFFRPGQVIGDVKESGREGEVWCKRGQTGEFVVMEEGVTAVADTRTSGEASGAGR